MSLCLEQIVEVFDVAVGFPKSIGRPKETFFFFKFWYGEPHVLGGMVGGSASVLPPFVGCAALFFFFVVWPLF